MNRTAAHFSLILLVTCVANVGFAQRFSFDPSNLWEQEYYKDDYSSNQIFITNETTEELAFRWKLVGNSFPVEWGFSICDLGSCFPIPPDSNDMNLTTAGGDAYFICHTSFNGFVGVGELALFVFEIGDEANGDTVIFRYTTTNVIGVTSSGQAQNSLMVFPNPASDMVYVNIHPGAHIRKVVVYNILGQPVIDQQTENAKRNQILVGNLRPGQYFVTVFYSNGERATGVFYKTQL